MEPKTLEELRKALIAELGAFQMTMFRTDTSDEEVTAFENAVRKDELQKILNEADFEEPSWGLENGKREGYEFDAGDPKERGIYILPATIDGKP